MSAAGAGSDAVTCKQQAHCLTATRFTPTFTCLPLPSNGLAWPCDTVPSPALKSPASARFATNISLHHTDTPTSLSKHTQTPTTPHTHQDYRSITANMPMTWNAEADAKVCPSSLPTFSAFETDCSYHFSALRGDDTGDRPQAQQREPQENRRDHGRGYTGPLHPIPPPCLYIRISSSADSMPPRLYPQGPHPPHLQIQGSRQE